MMMMIVIMIVLLIMMVTRGGDNDDYDCDYGGLADYNGDGDDYDYDHDDVFIQPFLNCLTVFSINQSSIGLHQTRYMAFRNRIKIQSKNLKPRKDHLVM